MMYQNKLVLAVKAGGKILREQGEKVFVPFGSEYSLLIKNLNSVRAQVKISIDGESATGGYTLVVKPNESIDLERYIKNGNMTEGNRFKFIERTAAVSNHRGDKLDDGIIRIEFEFEKVIPVQQQYLGTPTTIWDKTYTSRSYSRYDDVLPRDDRYTLGASSGMRLNSTKGGVRASGSSVDSTPAAHQTRGEAFAQMSLAAHDGQASIDWMDNEQCQSYSAAPNEVGITVPGSVSQQKFAACQDFPLDGVKHAIVMQIVGDVQGTPVVAPILAKAKPKCITCGKVNKANAKFCSECGTSLEVK